MASTDFHYKKDSSTILLYPKSSAAKDWVKTNLPVDSWQNTDKIPVEPFFFFLIFDAILDTILTISEKE